MSRTPSSRHPVSRLAIATCIVLCALPISMTYAQPGNRARVTSSERASARAKATWAAAMRRLRPPATGCHVANYPDVAWHQVPCGKAPDYPIIPARTPSTAFVVGGGGSNDITPRTAANTTSAVGSFPSVSSGVSETGQVNNTGAAQSDAYTLQLNTNVFNFSSSGSFPAANCSAAPGGACQGWEQYIYENNDSSHQTFIQYWVIQYNQTCPSGWFSYPYPGPSDISCYRNSASASLSGDQPVSNLGFISLLGEATATSDRVTTTGNGTMATTPGLNAVSVASGWRDSEFNIFGDAGGGQANFGANTSLSVQTLTHSGTTAAPTCVLESLTGETNNLTLTGMGSAGPLASPGVQFTQSNIPGTVASCIAASGLGDTHLRTFTGLLYDFQASGDFTLAMTGGFEAQTRQVSGAPTWPDAAVNQSVAARLGSSTVAVCSGKEPVVSIDRERRSLDDGQIVQLGDGSAVRRVGNFIIMIDPNGNSLRAELLGNYVNAAVGLGRWPTKVEGLLASSGRANRMLTGRDGKTIAAPYAFDQFYGQYGESWRVPRGKSMLDVCGPVTERGNPGRPFTVQNLNREVAVRARRVCIEAGIKQKDLLDACTLDVAVLGRKDAALVFRNLIAPTAFGPIK